MMLRPRVLVTGLLIAAPVAAIVALAHDRARIRDMELALSRVVRSQVNEQVKERCESDPRWFLAGPLDGRPKRGDPVNPDPELQPRPRVSPQPFELFAYGEGFTGASSAAPRFPGEFRFSLQRSSEPVFAPYVTPEGTGVQMAVPTGWTNTPCMYFLARMAPPPDQRSRRSWLLAAAAAMALAVALLATAPTVMRVRRLARDARESANTGYATIAPDKRRDELSSFMFAFNEAGNELRLRKSRIEDLEAGLWRFVQSTDEEIAEPLRRLEAKLGAVASDADRSDALVEAHDLAVRVENLTAAARLRMSNLPPPKSPVDLTALVRNVIDRHAPVARASGVTIETSLPDGSIAIEGDETLIERAVSNVVDNAIRYSGPDGNVKVTLARDDQAGFRLAVVNGGKGVTADEFRSLTAIRRFRGDEGRNRRPGAPGLGLAVAREVADRFHLQLDLRRPDTGGFEAEFSGKTTS